MIKIKNITLSKLLLTEIDTLVDEVTQAVGRNNPELLRLSDTYELLLEQKMLTAKIKIPYRGHSLTSLCKKLNEQRIIHASILATHVRALEIGKFEKTQHLVDIAYPLVKLHLMEIRKNNRVLITGKIRSFIYQLQDNPKEMDAFVKLGFKKHIEDLAEANKTYREVHRERKVQISKRPKVNKKAISADAQDMLRYFFHQIRRYQHSYKHLNYEPLINELNVVLAVHSKNINFRTTINERKNKQAKKTAEKTIHDNKTSYESNNLPAVIQKEEMNLALLNMVKALKSKKEDKSINKKPKKRKK